MRKTKTQIYISLILNILSGLICYLSIYLVAKYSTEDMLEAMAPGMAFIAVVGTTLISIGCMQICNIKRYNKNY